MFREYDIRGRENESELNSTTIELIGKAYGTFLRARGITDAVIGHDSRATSENFYKICSAALQSSGIHVTGIGMCLTPMMYWAQYHFNTKGGLMITASHNPAGWNGLKLSLGFSYTLIGNEVQEILKTAEDGKFTAAPGSFKEEKIDALYIKDLVSRVRLHRKLKILLNTANATSSYFSPQLFRQFGCEVIEHNTNPDPTYPHYPPNPANVAMIKDTGAQVIKNGCDLGIAIDADGDRLGITDEKGQAVWPDRYAILLARSILKHTPGAKIVFDVKVSEALPEDIRAHGGIPIMWKTGHSHVKKKVHEEKAKLAVEQSGHVFFTDNFYGFDDGNFAAVKLIELLSLQSEPLSTLVGQTPYYVSTPAYHAHTADGIKYGIVEKLTAEFKKDGNRVVDINGARVYFENGGWGLVRASSNLPALVLRFEAKDESSLKDIEKIFRTKLAQFPEVATEWESA